MRFEDDERFARLITTLAIATNTKLDTPTIELYFRALMDVPIELLEVAAIPLVQAARFFPKVAEWRIACDKVLDARDHAALGTGTQLQLGGDVGDGRCPTCDGTGWVHIEQECAREWRCHQYVQGAPHTHTHVKRCDECKGARDRKAEMDKRYGRPMWWEERD